MTAKLKVSLAVMELGPLRILYYGNTDAAWRLATTCPNVSKNAQKQSVLMRQSILILG